MIRAQTVLHLQMICPSSRLQFASSFFLLGNTLVLTRVEACSSNQEEDN